MRLNTLTCAPGEKTAAIRVGRGIGSGLGKTCGRGHKGQYARAGGFHKVGFEGGQMPMQRRLPKFGFTSRTSLHSVSLPLAALQSVAGDIVDICALQAAGLISNTKKCVKIYLSGELNRALVVKGVCVTQGARKAIEQAGGKVEA